MSFKLKASVLSLILFLSLAVATAQPSPPHEVYGNITDSSSSSPASNISVEAKVSGAVVASDTTNSNGYYSVKVASNYSGTDFDLFVDGNNENTFTTSSGTIEKYDVSGDYTTSSPDSGGSSFSVDVPDITLVENTSIEIEPTVKKAGSNPSYAWRFTSSETYNASLENPDEKILNFSAPSDVSQDREIDIELEVTKSGGSSKKGSATVTVTDTTNTETGGGGGGGGAPTRPDTNQSENQPETSPTTNVEARNEDGKARAEIERINASETVEVTVPSDASSDGEADVESVSFSSSTESNDVSVEVEDVGDDFNKVSTNVENKRPKGKVYSYQNIDVSNVEDSSITKASISFKVSKKFIEENKATVDDVRLNRFHNGEWETYGAENTGDTETHYRFKADTPGFSTYAISLDNSTEDTETPPSQPGTDSQNDQGGLTSIYLGIFGLVALLLVAALVWSYQHGRDLSDLGLAPLKEEDEEDRETNECGICEESFDSVDELEDHHRQDHEDHEFTCEECGRFFDTEKDLHVHQASEHGVKETEGFAHECGICGRAFDSMVGLNIHHSHKHDGEEYICTECGGEFDSREELLDHQEDSHE